MTLYWHTLYLSLSLSRSLARSHYLTLSPCRRRNSQKRQRKALPTSAPTPPKTLPLHPGPQPTTLNLHSRSPPFFSYVSTYSPNRTLCPPFFYISDPPPPFFYICPYTPDPNTAPTNNLRPESQLRTKLSYLKLLAGTSSCWHRTKQYDLNKKKEIRPKLGNLKLLAGTSSCWHRKKRCFLNRHTKAAGGKT